MKKIFKKSLAIMVSAAICLTALIGCLSVSAANGEAPVYTVATVEGKKGETVDVNVTGADLTEICGQDLSIIFAKGLTIGTVHDNITNEDLTCDPEGDGMQYNVIANDDGTNTVKMVDIINFPEYGEGESYNPALVTGTLNVTISVTIPADAAAGTEYPITINESQFADYDEEWVRPTLNNGKITVVEDAPVCTHENLEFVSAVPATEEANGTITFECADCGEQITEDVTYLVQSTLAAPTIGCTSTTQLIFRASIAANVDATDSVLIVTHKFMNGAPDEITTYAFEDAETDDTTYRWPVGVPSINYTDIFSTVLYTKRDGQWVSGATRDFSIRDSAMSTVKSAATDEATKLVCGNLLTMGAKAQLKFGYNTSDLADADLADYPQYVTTTVPTIEKTEENYIPVGSDFAEQKKAMIATPSIALSDSIAFNFRVVTSYYEGATDDLKVVVNYESFNGAPISETYNIEYVEGTAIYNLSVGVIAPNMRQPVSFTVYNGDKAISDTAVYSIESVLASAASSDPTVGDLVNAIINYSDSAQEAF